MPQMLCSIISRPSCPSMPSKVAQSLQCIPVRYHGNGGCGLRALPSAGASAGISQYDQHLAALSPHAVNQAPYPIMPEGCSDPPPSTQVHFPSLQRYHVNFVIAAAISRKVGNKQKSLEHFKGFCLVGHQGLEPWTTRLRVAYSTN